MKLVIAFAALIAVAVAKPQYGYNPYGYNPYGAHALPQPVQDTPEVAAAKAAHFAAVAQASRASGPSSPYNDGQYNPALNHAGQYNSAYNNPAYNPAPAYNHYQAAPYQAAPYGHGQFGPGGLPQPVQDTPEVAAARAAHLRAHAAAGGNPHYG